jgi:hypothetical protein
VTGAENFTTIVSIAPSPLDPEVIWVGSDDGRVHMTKDGGTNWTALESRLPGLAEGAWVTQIKASTYDAGGAFVVVEDHRRNNWTPYLYHTSDYGEHFERMAEDVWGYALSVVQDPIEPNLIFLGTEYGVHVSIDGGDTWTKWTNGMPTMSAMDMVIHPRDHDLVVGTFGRSVYVLDDIRPLRALAAEGADLLDARMKVFDAPDAYMAQWAQATGTRFSASAVFQGENAQRGAMISYVINRPERGGDESDGPRARRGRRPGAAARAGGGRAGRGPGGRGRRAKIEIVDADGEVIRNLTGPAEQGLNRFYWAMRSKGFRNPGGGGRFGGGRFGGGGDPNAEPAGPAVLPGTYKVRITLGRAVDSTTVTVHSDPRIPYNRAGAEARIALYHQLGTIIEPAGKAIGQLDSARDALKWMGEKLKADSSLKDLMEEHEAVNDSLSAVRELVFGSQGNQGIRRDPNTLSARLRTAQGYIGRSTDPPGETEEIALAATRAAASELVELVNGFMGGRWAEYVGKVEEAHLSWFDSFEPIELNR